MSLRQGYVAHLVSPPENEPLGVISFPCESRAFLISNVASMLEIAKKTVVSANNRPGQRLHHMRTRTSAQSNNRMHEKLTAAHARR